MIIFGTCQICPKCLSFRDINQNYILYLCSILVMSGMLIGKQGQNDKNDDDDGRQTPGDEKNSLDLSGQVG